jgi:hypothetical protein
MQILPVGAELFHANRRTDLTKLNRHFTQFCESVYRQFFSRGSSGHEVNVTARLYLLPTARSTEDVTVLLVRLWRE